MNRARWALLLLFAVACSNAPDTLPPPYTCEDVPLAAAQAWSKMALLGLAPTTTGCGVALAAFDTGWQSLSVGLTPCDAQPWPDGFTPASARTLAPEGLLVTNKEATKVVKLTATGPTTWWSQPLASAATVADADESPCGDRYVLLADTDANHLLRLSAAGGVLWDQPGPFTGLAAACDGVYVAARAVSAVQPSHYMVSHDAWLARLTPDGHELWRQVRTPGGDWTIDSVTAIYGGVAAHFIALSMIGYSDARDLESFHADGTPGTRHDIRAWAQGGNFHYNDIALRPVAWPTGAWTWPIAYQASGPSWVKDDTRVEIVNDDGTLLLSRSVSLQFATTAAVLGDGSLVIGGDTAWFYQPFGDAWAVRMPACAAPE